MPPLRLQPQAINLTHLIRARGGWGAGLWLGRGRARSMASDARPTLPSLHWEGDITKLAKDKQPSLAELAEQLAALAAAVDSFGGAGRRVHNLPKLSRRIRRELAFIERQQKLEQESGSTELQGVRLQGVINNLRGFYGEALALHEARDVVAVCTKFSSAPPQVWAPSCAIDQRPGCAPLAAGPGAPEERTEEGAEGAAGPARWRGEGCIPRRPSSSSSSSSCSSSGLDPGGVLPLGSHPDPAGGAGRAPEDRPGSPRSGPSRRTYTLQQPPPPAGEQPQAAGPPLVVEVDVVAHGGLSWVEVKNQEMFGTESIHWAGRSASSAASSAKGLAQQVADLLAVARAPANSRRWRSPEVVVFFPSGVTPEVAEALTQLGARVADGPGSLAQLAAPDAPSTTNLDVTSMCALVSEVSHGNPASPELQRWGARTTHWQECLAAEVAEPLLPRLRASVGPAQRLVASCVAVAQFQKLAAMFGGPREMQRWQELLGRLAVYHCREGRGSAACSVCGESLPASSAGGACGGGRPGAGSPVVAAAASAGAPTQQQEQQQEQQQQQEPLVFDEPARIAQCAKLGRQHRAVLGLGDALQAVTLTANGSAVRCAEQYGVKLEVLLHRAVWLAGM